MCDFPQILQKNIAYHILESLKKVNRMFRKTARLELKKLKQARLEVGPQPVRTINIKTFNLHKKFAKAYYKTLDCSVLESYADKVTFFSYFTQDLDISRARQVLKLFPHLETVNIYLGQSYYIPPDLFLDTPKLKKVTISGSKIEWLPLHLFKNNEEIESLSIDGEAFKGFPNATFFEHIPSLEELDITANKRTHLSPLPTITFSDNFCDANPHLGYLYIRKGEEQFIPKSCCDPYKLISVFLAHPHTQKYLHYSCK